MNDDRKWQLLLERNSAPATPFFYGVLTTRIFCRPGCPSRHPNRDNVRFFDTVDQAESAGFRACRRCRPTERPRELRTVEAACEYIVANIEEPLALDSIAGHAGVSKFHLIRLFKKNLGISPGQFASAVRHGRFRQELLRKGKVIDAVFEAGFGSTSRAYENARNLGMTPGEYRSGASGTVLRYAIFDSPIGRVLIARSDRGVCAIRLASRREDLLAELRAEFSRAQLVEDAAALSAEIRKLTRYLAGEQRQLDLPTDVRATAFQARVWQELRRTRFGETLSYSQLARRLGSPNAVRAVARACATNPVALVVPCHRVVREGGALAGYRWGLDRKKKLLEMEKKKA